MSQFRWQIVPDCGTATEKTVAKTAVFVGQHMFCSWLIEDAIAVSEKLDIIGQVQEGMTM